MEQPNIKKKKQVNPVSTYKQCSSYFFSGCQVTSSHNATLLLLVRTPKPRLVLAELATPTIISLAPLTVSTLLTLLSCEEGGKQLTQLQTEVYIYVIPIL